MRKTALIFGVTGQDGSYLSKFLLKKGYIVHGVKRRTSLINTQRIGDVFQEKFSIRKKLYLHYGDITDSFSVHNIIKKVNPDKYII